MVEDRRDRSVKSAVRVVSAYVNRNAMAASELPALIGMVHAALLGLETAATPLAPEAQKPAVSVRKSISDNYLTCLEDGRKFKSLKRHLREKYNMTPDQYRIKWQLPTDYPMVAPGYAQTRSAMAKSMGLGQQRRPPKLA